MPRKKTVERARAAARKGRAPSSQAGEFVREEIHHVRSGKHGARSAKQVIAIGLSKARRAGVKLRPPKRGSVSAKAHRSAQRAYRKRRSGPDARPATRRSKATSRALRREGRSAASRSALSRAAKKAARTKGSRQRSLSAQKAARSRAGKRRAA
jgi:hypothetical protein